MEFLKIYTHKIPTDHIFRHVCGNVNILSLSLVDLDLSRSTRSATKVSQFRDEYACCATHCRFSRVLIFFLLYIRFYY